MCKCEHELNTFDTHLICYPFKGQQIATHDAIGDIMHALSIFWVPAGCVLFGLSLAFPFCLPCDGSGH
jgi:hypothetical protein